MAMYLNFYGLQEKPFNLTPDPKFLYLTPAHQEALAQLLYGVQERKGFIVLTGEVGTGKTTLLHGLLRQLDGTTEVALIVNSKLSFDEMLEYALEDFGIAKDATSRAERLFTLNNFLIERCRAGLNTALILDEAQNLDPLTLEQVRLLSNFEAPTEKLLQILLVGQPELKATLELAELRQLRQRIGLRCSIRALKLEETSDYIRRRLRIAGSRDQGLFTEDAIRRVAEYAGGIPRVVNVVCDHCLLIGYADQKRQIDRAMVDEAIAYLGEGKGLAPQTPEPAPRYADQKRQIDRAMVDEAIAYLGEGKGLAPQTPEPDPRQRWAAAHSWVAVAFALVFLGGTTVLVLNPDVLFDFLSHVAERFAGFIRLLREAVSSNIGR